MLDFIILSEFSWLISSIKIQSTCPQFIIEFHEQFFFLLGQKIIDRSLVINYERTGSGLKFFIEFVVFGDFWEGWKVFFESIFLFSHGGESVADLVDNISEDGNTKDLNDEYSDNFKYICRRQIAIADSEHGGTSKIEWIQVQSFGALIIDLCDLNPAFWEYVGSAC